MPKKTARSFATSTSTEPQQNQKSREKFCEHCKGKNHDIDSCFKLAKLTTEEILKHLKEIGVCFGCLKKGKHHRKDCNKKLTCKKCGRYHPTILHQDKSNNVAKKEDKKQGDTQANSKTPENDKSEKAEKICRSTHTGAGDGQGPSPCIVPVKIQCRTTGIAVNTLAYLDSGSDAVFCTDQLRQQLGIKGKRTTLQVKTLTDERSVETYVLKGLEVGSVDGNHRIPLPDVYTQKSIPADSKDMVTEEEIRKWSYLQGVHLNSELKQGT